MKYKMTNIELALKAAVRAGKISLELRDAEFKVSHKESLRDIVTNVDLTAEKAIGETIQSSSSSPLFCEESLGQKLESDSWIVDPLDGTANYVAGNPNFTVCIAKLEGNELDLGVIYAPVFSDLYYTYGGRAYKNSSRITGFSGPINSAVIAFSLPGKMNEESEKHYWEHIRDVNRASRGVVRLGSAALHLAWTAEGRFGACIGFSAPLWDIAAGVCLARSAGLEIIMYEAHEAGKYNYICGPLSIVESLKNKICCDFDSRREC